MFLSRVTNALDAKGRVSVPADFRAVISSDRASGNFDGIIVWPSLSGPWLEGGGIALMREYQDLLDNMDPFDDDRIVFERTIFGEGRRLAFDANGRVSLPKDLAVYAGLDKQVTFVGLGRRFEILNPKDCETKFQQARAKVQQNPHRLRLGGKPASQDSAGSR
ncbi:MAG: division/cell wall cluster transcriptional repressor MraZ [Robiginitomaculum sp.]|nr:MAG: division/cell wall cluster transcriptional repressor MraZ [Robiginitomaculum sp.]